MPNRKGLTFVNPLKNIFLINYKLLRPSTDNEFKYS